MSAAEYKTIFRKKKYLGIYQNLLKQTCWVRNETNNFQSTIFRRRSHDLLMSFIEEGGDSKNTFRNGFMREMLGHLFHFIKNESNNFRNGSIFLTKKNWDFSICFRNFVREGFYIILIMLIAEVQCNEPLDIVDRIFGVLSSGSLSNKNPMVSEGTHRRSRTIT